MGTLDFEKKCTANQAVKKAGHAWNFVGENRIRPVQKNQLVLWQTVFRNTLIKWADVGSLKGSGKARPGRIFEANVACLCECMLSLISQVNQTIAGREIPGFTY